MSDDIFKLYQSIGKTGQVSQSKINHISWTNTYKLLLITFFFLNFSSKPNFNKSDSSVSATISTKPIFQNTTINLPSTSTRIDTGQNKINSLFNYLNLSLNDTKTLSRPSQSAMGPLSTSVLTNKIVNPMNVGISSYNRQFNYFDNDLSLFPNSSLELRLQGFLQTMALPIQPKERARYVLLR